MLTFHIGLKLNSVMMQSLSRRPRALVGSHLDQEVTPRVPRHVRRMLLHRSLLLRLCFSPGMSPLPFYLPTIVSDLNQSF